MSAIGIVVISVVMLCAVAGAIAAIFDSEQGLGKEFLDGLHAIGYIFVPVAGIMAAVPLLSQLVRAVVGPVYTTLGADPAMAATTFIAVDMGGYQLARSLTEVNLDKVRRKTGVPTQICVLAHIKTQLACLERGAPVEILFQSLGGTERTNLLEFDITVDLLDRAYHAMAERGPLKDVPQQCMYFETGQGSEYSYGKHNGIDMTTTEALCYGLARRYDPFMVNNVTGFIGPETHLDSFEMILSNLQDHFMGKLLGLPMGMAPCYTLHSNITLEGQQIATQLLTAAGANYFMDVCLNTDRMLAYFDTSGHDDQTLREVYGRQPAPESVEWGVRQGIFVRGSDGTVLRGPRWGDPRQFCESKAELRELLAATPAAYGFETAGPRPANAVAREVRLNQSVGREAIYAELSNIYAGGLPPAEGAGVVLEKIGQVLGRQAAGNRLEALLKM